MVNLLKNLKREIETITLPVGVIKSGDKKFAHFYL